jgi:DNA-binding response OmpR family regulator
MKDLLNILIVEDDENTRKLTSIRLRREGFNPLTAENGEVAVDILLKNKIHLALIDIMMPVMDGMELLRYMRSNGFTLPVIMTTAKESIEDKKACFQLGADDYIVKPIDKEELILRIRAVLRRSNVLSDGILKIGNITLNANLLTVSSGEKSVPMPKKEFEILYCLLSRPDKVFTKNELMDEFWGYDTETFNDTVKVHINRIRSRIEPFGEIGIRTVRGVGYKGEIKGEIKEERDEKSTE